MELRRYLCLLVLALLLPGAVAAETRLPPRDLMLVLDNSGSMRRNDPGFLLRDAVRTFVNSLQGDVRLGVVIFDAGSTLAVPLTPLQEQGRKRVLESLAAVDYRGRFTDIPGAIERALYELKRKGRPDARRSIVFITDGIVDTGDEQRDRERKSWLERALVADAAEEGIRIFAIAFTEKADFQLIQTLAEKSDGDYFRAPTASDLPGVFAHIDRLLARGNPQPPPEPPPAPLPAAPVHPAAAPPAMEAPVKEPPTPGPPPESPTSLPAPAAPSPALDQDPRLRIFAGAVLILLLLILLLLSRRRTRESRSGGEALPEAWLMELGKGGEPVRHRLGHRATILGRVAGKETADLGYIVVGHSTVGRRHALIEYRDYGFWLIDQGSVNGTFLNGERITGEARLKHGDRIRLHRAEFEFQLPEMDDGGQTVYAGPDAAARTLLMNTAELPEPLSPEEARLEEELLAPTSAMDYSGESDTFVRGEPLESSFHEQETDVREEPVEPVPPPEPASAPSGESASPGREEAGPAAETATSEVEFDMESFMDSGQFDATLGGLELEATEEATVPPRASQKADEQEDRTLAPGVTGGEDPDPLDSFISTTLLEEGGATGSTSPDEEETEVHPDVQDKRED